jgi:hypothetical protein
LPTIGVSETDWEREDGMELDGPDKDALKKCLFEEQCCWYCGCGDFLEGPSGGMSQNMMCASCGARYNVCSPFFAELIGLPTAAPGCLMVGRQEREEGGSRQGGEAVRVPLVELANMPGSLL